MPVSLYTHRTERCRYALIVFLLLPCLFARADAQEPVRWLNYTYDSTFRFGAHVAKFPRYLKDSVRLDFAQTYQGPADFTTADAQWQNRLRIADTIGFHYIYTPDPIRGVQLSGKVGEFYVRRNADVIFTKEIQTVVDSLVNDPLYSQYFVKSLFQPPVPGGPHQLFMGERLRFAGNTFQLPTQGFYDTAYQYYVPWPGWEELKDNLFTWKVELTMRADEIPQSMPDNTVLAYAHLYRRVDTLQGADTMSGAGFPCLCALYEPFDTLAITKALYQASVADPYQVGFENEEDGTRYYDVGKFVDFFRDSIYGMRDSVWNTGIDSGTIRVIDYSVLLPRLDVPVGESSLFSNNASLGWQTGIPDSCVTEYCTRLLDSLQGWGAVNPGTLNYGVSVESSDFDMKIYSTGLVPVTVVRAKLSHYFHHMTRQGLADTLIRLGIAPFYRPENAQHNRVMLRFGVSDEPDPTTYRQTGILSTRTQDIMQESAIAQGLTENRNIYMNANQNYDGMRLFTGDMDTVRRKVVHVFPAQFYPIGVLVPMYYANPDTALMSEEALSITYKLNSLGDTVSVYRDSAISETESVKVFVRIDSLPSKKWIMGPSLPDYQRYTAEVQKNFGLFSNYRNVFSASTGPGEPMVSQLARAVDASRFKYSSRPNITSHPVWYVVQVHGQTGSNRRQMADFFRPPPTREEITAQCWLALNCGVDGLMLSDLVFTGELFGALRRTEAGYRHDQEYDTLAEAELNPSLKGKTDKTWVGFKSRYEGIERAINHFRDTIVPVYENLVYNQKQMSVHDPAQTFASIPLVDTLMAERAKQFDSTGFHHIGVFDPRDSTYLEVSHLLPGHRDSVGLARNAEYLIVTNRRTWPIDFKTYTDTALGRMRRAARFDTARGYNYVQGGLGNIDVRRPWLALKNTTGVIADSFVVEKVGGGWLDTVAVGE